MNFIRDLFKSNNTYTPVCNDQSFGEIWESIELVKPSDYQNTIKFRVLKTDQLYRLLADIMNLRDNDIAIDKRIKEYQSLSEVQKVNSPRLDMVIAWGDYPGHSKIHTLKLTILSLIEFISNRLNRRRISISTQTRGGFFLPEHLV